MRVELRILAKRTAQLESYSVEDGRVSAKAMHQVPATIVLLMSMCTSKLCIEIFLVPASVSRLHQTGAHGGYHDEGTE
jgi:hypothetical protein